MKTHLIHVGFLLAGLIAAACDVAAPEPGTLADGLVHPVIYEGPGGSQAFIIELGDGRVALIDTGVEKGAEPIMDALDDLDKGPEDVAAIFITHGHTDHISGAPAFDAPIYAMEAERDLIAGKVNPERPFPNTEEPEETGIEIDVVVEDGDTIGLGYRTFEVFGVRGHTDGHAVYLSAGVLFMGDTMTTTSAGLEGSTWVFSKDTEENDRSLAALAQRLDRRRDSIHTIAPAHSAAVGGGLEPLEAYLDQQGYR